jgi:hypothetical protein
LLGDYLKSELGKLEGNSKWFMQDAASPRFLLSILTFCMIISQIGGRGPTITGSESYGFRCLGYFKSRVYGVKFINEEKPEQRIRAKFTPTAR